MNQQSLLLPRKSLLAIAAVIDVALHARPTPVAAKALASRHNLPPRHLETLLQELVRAQILKGVRGPKGGYELARERRRMSLGDIVRASLTMNDVDSHTTSRAPLFDALIQPHIQHACTDFLIALDKISVEYVCQSAHQFLQNDQMISDFTI